VETAVGLQSSVLVLNRFFMAVHVVSAKRAFAMLCKRVAEVVHIIDDRYDSFNFESWREISQYRELFGDGEARGTWIRTVSFEIRVPEVVRLVAYDRMPRQRVKLNRRNIFARDDNRCQYCGRRFPSSELSLDHVVPRSRNGLTSWRNLVCACTSCNKRKGGRTPAEANMRLIRPARQPKRSPIIRMKLRSGRYGSWKAFLDTAYWSVELK